MTYMTMYTVLFISQKLNQNTEAVCEKTKYTLKLSSTWFFFSFFGTYFYSSIKHQHLNVWDRCHVA